MSESRSKRSIQRQSPARLVREAQQGSDAAFAELIALYQDAAVAFAAAVLRDFDLAHDAAQDAFVDAHRLFPTLREPAAFPLWFRKIVFKHCDRYRRRQRRLVALDAVHDVHTALPSPLEILETRERVDAVRSAIDRLPARERTVVLLFYMADQSQAAIAAFLGINVNTVKTRLYSARERLRSMLDDMIAGSLEEERPSRDPRFIRRVIASVLPLQVYWLDAFGRRVSSGLTVSARTAEAPTTKSWFVEPRGDFAPRDWDEVMALMSSMRIPGLAGAGQVDDAVLERLARMADLTYLDLSGCSQVTDRGLLTLANCASLEHLDVSGTAVTDDGLRVLRSLPDLKSFQCRHTATISDAGVEHLRDATKLERVNLMGTRTGDGALASLHGKAALRELFVGSRLTDSGLAALSNIPRFIEWRDDPFEMSLLSAQAHGAFLWLNVASPISDRGLFSIQALQGLVGLSLFGGANPAFDDRTSAITPAGISALEYLPNLAWFGCTSRLCDDDAMRRIARFPALRFLMCQDTVAGDAGFRAIAESPSIAFIWGRRCYNLSSVGFRHLARMESLRGLAVSCRNVGDAGLAALPEFSRLSEFMPIDVTDEGFRFIAECKQLDALHCMYCTSITDGATQYIAELPRLRTYQAWGTRATDQTLRVLAGIQSLEHIRLSSCAGVSDEGLLYLRRSPRLKAVELEHLPNVSIGAAALLPSTLRVNYRP